MRISYKTNGELISLNDVVNGAHQGFEGFKDHSKQRKASNEDKDWNKKIVGFKYINHQGTLQNSNRVVSKVEHLNVLKYSFAKRNDIILCEKTQE